MVTFLDTLLVVWALLAWLTAITLAVRWWVRRG